MTAAYPLDWPVGWPRTATPADGRYKFARGGSGERRFWTLAAAFEALEKEAASLGTNVVVSANIEVGARGGFLEKYRGADPGVAVYFTELRSKRQVSIACDRFTRAEENMRSLALALEAMRQLERHGGSYVQDRAFSGFMALPAPDAIKPRRPWHEVFGVVPSQADAAIIGALYRVRAKACSGDEGALSELNVARDEALAAIGPKRLAAT